MSDDPKIIRLSVNINAQTASELRRLSASKGWTITETVRRTVGVGAEIYKQDGKGREIIIQRPGRRAKKVLKLQ